MKEKNLALEMLRKILEDQIKVNIIRKNLVKSEKFSEKLRKIMDAFVKNNLTNEMAIKEMMELAKEIMGDGGLADKLGLSEEEKIFYDALTKPEAIEEFYKDDTLIRLTKDLTKNMQKNMTLDWHKKEAVRAKMRYSIRKLLEKYNYPPESQKYAVDIVLKQCANWAGMYDPED